MFLSRLINTGDCFIVSLAYPQSGTNNFYLATVRNYSGNVTYIDGTRVGNVRSQSSYAHL